MKTGFKLGNDGLMIISDLIGSKQVSPHAQPRCGVSTAVTVCEFKFSLGTSTSIRSLIRQARKVVIL